MASIQTVQYMNLVNISYFSNQQQDSGIYNFSYNQRQHFHLYPKLVQEIITNPTTPLIYEES